MKEFSPIQAFVICATTGTPNSVKRLRITEDAREQIESILESQMIRFVDTSLDKVVFDPTYHTEDKSVLWIEGFNLPVHVSDTILNPQEIPDFTEENDDSRVKALFYLGADKSVFFQCWRNFEIFNRNKIWLLMTGNTFDVETSNKPPLVIEKRIDSVYYGGDLYFRSYANTSSMLEMLEYVTEATDEDIDQFVKLPIFKGDAAKLAVRCSKLQRKQIRSLVQSNKLGDKKFAELFEKAASVNYDIPYEGEKIVIPDSGKGLTDLLGFLNDRVYLGPVTGTELFANSARQRSSG